MTLAKLELPREVALYYIVGPCQGATSEMLALGPRYSILLAFNILNITQISITKTYLIFIKKDY